MVLFFSFLSACSCDAGGTVDGTSKCNDDCSCSCKDNYDSECKECLPGYKKSINGECGMIISPDIISPDSLELIIFEIIGRKNHSQV